LPPLLEPLDVPLPLAPLLLVPLPLLVLPLPVLLPLLPLLVLPLLPLPLLPSPPIGATAPPHAGAHIATLTRTTATPSQARTQRMKHLLRQF
jgi:hypothetical protein